MSNIISLDHEIMQLPDTIGVLWVCQTSQRNWVAIKVHYGISESVCWVGTNRDWDLSLRVNGEVSLGPLGNAHHLSLASISTNELVAR